MCGGMRLAALTPIASFAFGIRRLPSAEIAETGVAGLYEDEALLGARLGVTPWPGGLSKEVLCRL